MCVGDVVTPIFHKPASRQEMNAENISIKGWGLQVDAQCIAQQQSCGGASFVGHGVGRRTSKQDEASMNAGTHMLPIHY